MKESEDNLENFFRNRAEGNQYDFKEDDWAKMEAKLDAEMPVVAPFPYANLKWMAIGSVITVLLMLSYNMFFLSGNEFEQTSISIDQSVNPTQLKSLSSLNEIESLQNDASSKALVLEEKGAKGTSINNTLSSTKAKNAGLNSAEITKNKSELNSKKYQNKIRKNLEPSNTLAFTDKKDVKNSSKRLSGLQEPDVIPEIDPKKVDYVFEKGTLLSFPIEKVKVTPELIKTKKIYTLSLMGAIDVTSTKASDWGDPTVRLGLSGEYYIGNRWSIGIGANLSKKKYQAKGSEYSPPKGFWTNGIVPDSTNAVCDVLDVPITVNYFQPINNKSNLIISGGVSSWFMLKEEYWYKYKSNDPDLVNWWGGENENRYWFSVINLSVSYEYALTKKWSVAVGPYINIPLSGVGHGNVELQSFGLKGALRFNKFKLSKY